jgi:hypothetical protein
VALAAPSNHSQDGDSLLVAYYRAIDCGDLERAGTLLDRAARLPGLGWDRWSPAFQVELAYFSAFHHGLANEGRRWLERVPSEGIEEHTWRRAEAAVLLAERRFAEAVASADAGLAAVPLSRDPGGPKAERELLEAVARAARAGLARGRGGIMLPPGGSIKRGP